MILSYSVATVFQLGAIHSKNRLKTSLLLRIFYQFSENAHFCVEKCKIFALYFQGFMKNVRKK